MNMRTTIALAWLNTFYQCRCGFYICIQNLLPMVLTTTAAEYWNILRELEPLYEIVYIIVKYIIYTNANLRFEMRRKHVDHRLDVDLHYNKHKFVMCINTELILFLRFNIF